MNQEVEPKWHVLYTRPKTERIVSRVIQDFGLETYLPLYKTIRQWSDRKKKLTLPLFPNYVFVKVSGRGISGVRSIRDVVGIVSIEKNPVVIRDEEISKIKRILNEDLNVYTEVSYSEGTRVKIRDGQFAGLEGVVVKKNGKMFLSIKIGGFEKSFLIEVSPSFADSILESSD